MYVRSVRSHIFEKNIFGMDRLNLDRATTPTKSRVVILTVDTMVKLLITLHAMESVIFLQRKCIYTRLSSRLWF